MYSVMMTGYMFKNAQYRLELQQGLEQVALPEVQDKKVLILVATLYRELYIFNSALLISCKKGQLSS